MKHYSCYYCECETDTFLAFIEKSTIDINPEYESMETLLNQMGIGTPLPVDDEIISYEDDLHELINLMPAYTEKLKE